jgi:hypothetical protein
MIYLISDGEAPPHVKIGYTGRADRAHGRLK